MKLNTELVLVNYQGKTLYTAQPPPPPCPQCGYQHEMEEPEPMTLAYVVVGALNTPTERRPMNAPQKYMAWSISRRITEGEPLELSVKEAAFLEERTALVFPPVVFGAVKDMLDGNTDEKE